jgi:hypothetical protein
MSNQSIEVDVLFMGANQTIVIKFRCTLTLQRKRIVLNVFANWWPILKFFEGVMAILEKSGDFLQSTSAYFMSPHILRNETKLHR